MRLAILSDIHANLHAFEATLEHVSARDADAIWFLGDAVGYGGDPEETTRRLAELNVQCAVRGNHDKVVAGIEEPDTFSPAAKAAALRTRELVSAEATAWLRSLPEGPVTIDDLAVCHGSWEDEDGYIFLPQEAAATFHHMTTSILFFGHSHRAGVFAQFDGSTLEMPFEPEVEMTLRREGRYLINPGSIGQPRDRDPRAAYALFDTAKWQVTFFRLRYDVRQAQKRILEAGLPEINAARLAEGR